MRATAAGALDVTRGKSGIRCRFAMSRISLRTRNRCQLRNRAVLVDGLARYLPPRSVSDAFCGIAVDHEGEVLDAVVTATRDKRAALTVLKRLLKRHGRPRQIVTHGLQAYAAAMIEIGVVGGHRSGRRSNNRAENSHQPFRRREHAMQQFPSRATLQKFVSVHAQIHNHFNLERHLRRRADYKQGRGGAGQVASARGVRGGCRGEYAASGTATDLL
jgi:DDE domain